ncbi:MAG: DNA alkylation repair protein [Bacteroidaceae bacterium]|nr:DNA alkylation repair protein [Bacteroidaceae bacterium]
MNNEQVLSDIKKELRSNMNGVASAAMRQTEDYRVNFGVELPRLHSISSEFEPDHELAQTLWKEHVRECRILATILMPTDGFDEELCDIWAADIHTVEIAQIFALNLVRRLPYASQKAFEWIACDQQMLQVLGYFTMCHVLRMGEMNERSAEELLDQLSCDIHSQQPALQNAAIKTLQIFALQSENNAPKAKKMSDYLL